MSYVLQFTDRPIMTTIAFNFCKPSTVRFVCWKCLCNRNLSFNFKSRIKQKGVKARTIQETYFSTTSLLLSDDINISKLTSKDEENILYSLNYFSKEQLEKTGVVPSVVLEEMLSRRTLNGPFLSLGDVLSIPGMENDVFKKICHNFQLKEKRKSIICQDPEFIKYFSPSLSADIMESIQTVTCLEVCLDSVCFASATRGGCTIDWGHVSLLGSNLSKQSPSCVFEEALHVVQHIPKTDAYLLETRMLRKVSPQYVQILLFIARLQTAVQTLLSSHELSAKGQHTVFFVKDMFVARTFDLHVGGERVSGQQVLQEMEDGEFPDGLEVAQSLWHRFHRLRTGVEKERYANCLLMASAFIHYLGPGQRAAE